jgi:succinate dehydrogenase / fumarate reductase cytochrome b subunit
MASGTRTRAVQRTHRPTFLNLARIRFPVGAVASIGHRISGIVLVFALPFAFYALERSLRSEAAFGAMIELMRLPVGRAVLVLLAWASAHHLFAGIRHLLMDVGVGASLGAARTSAYATLGAAVAIAAAAVLLA